MMVTSWRHVQQNRRFTAPRSDRHRCEGGGGLESQKNSPGSKICKGASGGHRQVQGLDVRSVRSAKSCRTPDRSTSTTLSHAEASCPYVYHAHYDPVARSSVSIRKWSKVPARPANLSHSAIRAGAVARFRVHKSYVTRDGIRIHDGTRIGDLRGRSVQVQRLQPWRCTSNFFFFPFVFCILF